MRQTIDLRLSRLMPVSLEQARAAKTSARTLFAGRNDVVGIGIGKSGDDYVVRVNVLSSAKRRGAIPRNIEGVRIVLVQVGPARKLATRPTMA